MRVNNYSNVSFNRAIEVKNCSRSDYKKMKEVSWVLNGNKSKLYNDEQSKNIKNFFIDILGDYDGKNGVSLRKTSNNRVFLLSGDEAKRLRKLENRYEHDFSKKEIVDRFIFLKNENSHGTKPAASLKVKSDKQAIKNFTYEFFNSTKEQENNQFKPLSVVDYYTKELDLTV